MERRWQTAPPRNRPFRPSRSRKPLDSLSRVWLLVARSWFYLQQLWTMDSLFRQFLLHDFAQHVKQQFVRFLNSRRRFSRSQNIERGHSLREPSIATQETNAFEAHSFGLFEREQHIL